MKKRRMSAVMMGTLLASMLAFAAPAFSGLSVINDPYTTGAADWAADVRFRNFQTAVSGDYEMLVNATPDRSIATGGPHVNGHVPNFAYNQAAWAQNNDFWITYNPTANSGAGSVSLRLVGSGPQAGGATGGYDVTISRAPDAVTAGPVNYIEFSLWDRNAFPTIPGGLTISSLGGQNLGTFSLTAAGIDSWAIIDPSGLTLNNGFILQGSFTVDLTKLDGGKEGDKVIFGIGNHSSVPVVPIPGAVWLLGSGLLGLVSLRSRMRK